MFEFANEEVQNLSLNLIHCTSIFYVHKKLLTGFHFFTSSKFMFSFLLYSLFFSTPTLNFSRVLFSLTLHFFLIRSILSSLCMSNGIDLLMFSKRLFYCNFSCLVGVVRAIEIDFKKFCFGALSKWEV